VVKPLLQLIFEQLYDVGIREFCFVIGRGKRAIEDHFTQDPRFLGELRGRGAVVRVCDPAARAQGMDVIRDPGRCLDGADAAVLATEWEQFRDLEPEDFLRMRGRVVVDTRRIYDPGKFGAAGIRLIQLGRGPAVKRDAKFLW